MPSSPYQPSSIFVDEAVFDTPLTQKILQRFSHIQPQIISNIKEIKKPLEMNFAKKNLLLTRMKADPLKEFKAMTQSAERPYYSLNLISNCHLECTYCILQSYLANNPLITLCTNLEEILNRLEMQIAQISPDSLIGTGKIADSLALDEISEHTLKLVPFFAKQKHVRLELKTKSSFVKNLIHLDHQGKTIVSWSMNPPQLIQREEYKTASFEERLEAAKQVSSVEYPIAFHFDPLILHKNWKQNYTWSIREIFKNLSEKQIAWISLGALRFPAKQRKIIQERFPKNKPLLNQLISSHQTFLHYPDQTRNELQDFIEHQLLDYLPKEKIYRCMDF